MLTWTMSKYRQAQLFLRGRLREREKRERIEIHFDVDSERWRI